MALTEYDRKKVYNELWSQNKDTVNTEVNSTHINRPEFVSAIAALDDWFETKRVEIKTTMETACGKTLSNTMAKLIGKYWMRKKWSLE